MMSHGFVDLMLFLLLVGFTVKGWVTGFIRSVITFVAVIGAWMVSAITPNLTNVVLRYSIHEGSLYHDVATRISTFLLYLVILQGVGFLLTGLFENLNVGTLDKFVGVCLGAVTGAVVGCFMVAIFFIHPVAYWSPAGQSYIKTSIFFKAYAPMVKKFVHAPRKVDDD